MNTTYETNPSSSSIKNSKNSTKKEEQFQNHKIHDLVLDLSLCRNDLGSANRIDKIDKYNNLSENTQNLDKIPQDKDEEGEEASRVFSCNYCQRKFYSSQALGGHQNAHKRERTLAKRVRKSGSITSIGNNYYPQNLFKSTCTSFLPSLPCPSKITYLPLHGTCSSSNPNNNNNNHHHKLPTLGIQTHSLIHKSSNNMPFSNTISSSSSSSHHSKWPNVVMIDQQKPAIGRLGMITSSSLLSSSSTTSLCDGGAKFGGVISWKGNIVNNNVENNSSLDVLQDHDHLDKLDLSLKL